MTERDRKIAGLEEVVQESGKVVADSRRRLLEAQVPPLPRPLFLRCVMCVCVGGGVVRAMSDWGCVVCFGDA